MIGEQLSYRTVVWEDEVSYGRDVNAAIANSVPRTSLNQERQPGTLERAGYICKRLGELRERLSVINHNLHGPRPVDATGTKEPIPDNLRLHVESAHDLLTACEEEVNEIFRSLGL